MTTAQLHMAQAVVELLKVSPPVAGGRIFPARTRSISAEQPNGVVVRLRRSLPQLAEVIGGPTEWRTLITVECYGRVTGGAPDAAADQIVEDVFARLASDPTLGNAAMKMAPAEDEAVTWDFDELDDSLACITALFVITHQTIGRTLTR